MPTILTKPALEPTEPERRLQEVLNEFYGKYFNGRPTVTPDGSISFVDCNLGFNAAALDFSKPVIHTIFGDLRPVRTWETDGKRHYMVAATLTIYARVQNKGDADSDELTVRRIGDQVRYLFEAPSLRAGLSQKGIARAKVVRGPVPQPVTGYQVRLLMVDCTLRYAMTI